MVVLLPSIWIVGYASAAWLSSASAQQIPLETAVLPGTKEPLVDSTELQDRIDGENLMRRAEKLYEIARLSEDAYGHPTRVIGSAGTPSHRHIT